MKALIFAAGLGTRLKEITATRPKALVEVAGRPLLGHLIERLKLAGFTEVVINICHFADQIEEYLAANNNFGIKISLSREEGSPLETGGGIRRAAPLIGNEGPFLAHNVDIISNLNLKEFCSSHVGLATLLVSPRKTTRYFLFRADMRLCGWINMESGVMRTQFTELKEEYMPYVEGIELGSQELVERIESFLKFHSISRYAFAGTHLISPSVFGLMKEWPEKFSIVDFYLEFAAKYEIRGYLKEDLTLIDVGRPEHISIANEFLTGPQGSAIYNLSI